MCFSVSCLVMLLFPGSDFHPSLPRNPRTPLWWPLSLFLLFFFSFLGPHPWHMKVSRLEVESEPQLPAYTTATATPDPSHICDLHHSSWQCQILNPLSEAGDGTHILVETSWVCYCRAIAGTPLSPVPLDAAVRLDSHSSPRTRSGSCSKSFH